MPKQYTLSNIITHLFAFILGLAIHATKNPLIMLMIHLCYISILNIKTISNPPIFHTI